MKTLRWMLELTVVMGLMTPACFGQAGGGVSSGPSTGGTTGGQTAAQVLDISTRNMASNTVPVLNATTATTATNAWQLLDASGNVITHSIVTYTTNTVATLDYSRIWGTNPAAPTYGGNGWSYTNSGGYFTNVAHYVIGYTNIDFAWENGPMPFSSLNIDNDVCQLNKVTTVE